MNTSLGTGRTCSECSTKIHFQNSKIAREICINKFNMLSSLGILSPLNRIVGLILLSSHGSHVNPDKQVDNTNPDFYYFSIYHFHNASTYFKFSSWSIGGSLVICIFVEICITVIILPQLNCCIQGIRYRFREMKAY